MALLWVNIDHIATLRQARGGSDPDPVHAAVIAELAGAQGIAAYLHEDRRYVQQRDVYLLKQTIASRLNLVVSPGHESIQTAIEVVPAMITIVPERQDEHGAVGGLRAAGREKELAKIIERCQEHNIHVCLFIDPDQEQIRAASAAGATHIQLHCGYYAHASGSTQSEEIERLRTCAQVGQKRGLRVIAGWGLTYRNAGPIAGIEYIDELHIGHAIIARAALTGMDVAVRDMLALL
jgi:pyridoxine 5-phosphate synthase